MASHFDIGKNKIALPLHYYRTFQKDLALVTLPDGKSTSRQDGAGDGKRPQGTADQDRRQHELTFGGQLPRPGRTPQGGSWRQNSVLGFLGGLGGHFGNFARKGHGGGKEEGGEGSWQATGAEAVVLNGPNCEKSSL